MSTAKIKIIDSIESSFTPKRNNFNKEDSWLQDKIQGLLSGFLQT